MGVPMHRWEAPAAPVLAGGDCGDRDSQKVRDGRVQQKLSQTETGSKSDVGVASGQSPGSAPGQAHMDIPVASDGRVGSALRAAWCRQGWKPSMGSQAWEDRKALPTTPRCPEGSLHWTQM